MNRNLAIDSQNQTVLGGGASHSRRYLIGQKYTVQFTNILVTFFF